MLLLLLFTLSARALPTEVTIERLASAVKIDGDLSDDAWQRAKRVEGFVEYIRGDNAAPPVTTVGYLAYDDEALYVAFAAHDPRATEIRAPLVDRDKVLGDQDYVAILIDTANERRSGLAFRVNPRGIQTDSVVNDATGEEDFSPDFFYEAVARRTAEGWAAELRIPLASLRYPATDPQTWGVILMRNYPRDYRYVMSNTPIPKNSGCFLCHAASLTGLAGLPAGSHFTLAPYATGAAGFTLPVDQSRRVDASRATGYDSETGLDLKWNPSTRLTIDATLNPDFSQIEADVPQSTVNTRFALSFPEKRTFFLESVDLLKTPISAVYTRTIHSPAWGMRATGNLGASAYTFLVAEDRGGGSVILPGARRSDVVSQESRSRIALGRIRRSFGESFGAFLVSAREVEGGGYNRVAGPDFLWRRNARDKVTGQFLFSSTENPVSKVHPEFDGRAFDGHAARLIFQRDAKRYDVWAAAAEFAPGFRADNGFVVQNGFRRLALWTGIRTYPKGFFSYVRPYSGVEFDGGYEHGEMLRRGFYQGVEFEGKYGSNGWMSAQYETERVGSQLLDVAKVEFTLRAAPRSYLPAIQLEGDVGQKIDYAGARVGRGARLNLSATTRATDHVELQLMTSRDWLDLDDGPLFDARIDWLRLTYTFSARSLVRVVGQRKDVTRRGSAEDEALSLSGLYAWKLNWQTVFFVGYGDSSITGERGDLVRDSRSLFMKVAYAFQR